MINNKTFTVEIMFYSALLLFYCWNCGYFILKLYSLFEIWQDYSIWLYNMTTFCWYLWNYGIGKLGTFGLALVLRWLLQVTILSDVKRFSSVCRTCLSFHLSKLSCNQWDLYDLGWSHLSQNWIHLYTILTFC